MRDHGLAVFAWAGITFCWIGILFWKYSHFAYYDWDLALAAHALWNLADGRFFSSLYGVNFLTNHAEYIALFLVPLYKICPQPFLLIVLKVLATTGGGFLLYLLSRPVIGRIPAVLFMILFVFFPANIYMLLYEFHFENLAIFFILLCAFFFYRQNFPGFVLAATFAALTKENIALVVAMFGFYALLHNRPKKWRWVVVPVVIGLGIFFTSMFVVIPHLREQAKISYPNHYIPEYFPPAETAPDSGPTNPVAAEASPNKPAPTRPPAPSWRQKGSIWISFLCRRLGSHQNLKYFFETFRPWLFLPLLAPQVLLLGVPLFLQHTLSSSPVAKLILYHYASSLTPIIFLAMLCVFDLFKRRFPKKIFVLLLTTTMISCAMNILLLARDTEFRERMSGWSDRLDQTRREILAQIPPGDPVIATYPFLPELSRRKSLYTFRKIWTDANIFNEFRPYPLPENVPWAILDSNDIWLWEDVLARESQGEGRGKRFLRNLNRFFSDADWRLVFGVENLLLFKKDAPTGIKMIEHRLQPFITTEVIGSPNQDGSFELQQCLIGGLTKGKGPQCLCLLPLTFYWHCLRPVDSVYYSRLYLVRQNHVAYASVHVIGSAIYPTMLWQKGEYIKEHLNLLVSDLPQGEYSLFIEFIDFRQDKTNPENQPAIIYPLGAIKI